MANVLARARTAPQVGLRAAPGCRLARTVRRNLRAHGFLIGAVLCFALFTWYPMIREVEMSFQRLHRGTTSWVGLANYRQIMHDPVFWQAWGNTLKFTLIALVLGFVA